MPVSTEQLITSLARRTPAVPRRAVPRRIALGLTAGGAVTLALVLGLLGVRADLTTAAQSFAFWIKLLYSLSIAAGTTLTTVHLARPTSYTVRGLWLIAVPVLLLTGIGIGELAQTPADTWQTLWLGRSWRLCPWLVLGLSVPPFLGLLWSFRSLAPARLRLAGAAAGLASGAWAATLYCLHCNETAAVFVLSWYSLGMALAALAGAVLAPRLLRW